MLILPHLFCFCTAILGTVPFINIPALLYVTENRWLEKKSIAYKLPFWKNNSSWKSFVDFRGFGIWRRHVKI